MAKNEVLAKEYADVAEEMMTQLKYFFLLLYFIIFKFYFFIIYFCCYYFFYLYLNFDPVTMHIAYYVT